jgi:formiminotetrahydrofolate cyclodeaminase
MARLTDLTVSELLKAFSSSDPTPGGGSASALASSIGCALLIMVASLNKTRSNTEEEVHALRAAASLLFPIRDRLLELVDRDSQAYDDVVRAYKMPKASADEKAARSSAIQAALRGATEVPLEVMRKSVEALQQGVEIAKMGHRAAASDVAVALELAAAGLRGAGLNVRINLEGLSDREFADFAQQRSSEFEASGLEAFSAGQAQVFLA